MSKFSRLLILCLVLSLFAVQAQAYPGGAAPAQSDAAPSTPSGNVGTVVQTMNSGGYTYVLLENNGRQVWAAMAETEIKVGEQVELKKGMAMKNFTSQSLNRTFETIYFTQGVVKR